MLINRIIQFIRKIITPLSLLVFIVIFLDLGLKFHTSEQLYFRTSTSFFELFYILFFLIFFFPMLNKSRHFFGNIMRMVVWLSAIVLLFITFLGIVDSSWLLTIRTARDIVLLLISFIIISHWLNGIEFKSLHPTFIFILSFLIVILIGTVLLLLPNSTTHSVSFIDALFTATSAVTVTGLAVKDTAHDFTQLGQTFIMICFQIGGLGILTFTNLLVISIGNRTSFRTRLMIGEFVNEENLNHTFKMLISIITFTFLVEALSAFLVYHSIIDIPEIHNKTFFALFHAISAFCNAGFSTLQNSFHESYVRFNYNLHWIIGLTIVIGAMGFNIISYYWEVFLYKFLSLIEHITGKRKRFIIKKKQQSISNSISVITTFLLIFGGMLLFYILENNHALSEYSNHGKIAESFFNSVTTRTAGFNTLDMNSLTIPTLMIFSLLMWIGAAPGSTGGGIKTTTFAVGLLNIIRHITQKKNIRIKWIEISNYTISRMFAVVSLSLIAIGMSSFLLIIFDPQVKVKEAIFECISAYSTVGLSLGITSELSIASKVVLIVVMFIGRINFLTFLSGIFLQLRQEKIMTASFKTPKINIYS